MERLISTLEDLAFEIRNMKDHLQTVELPSPEARSLAIDVGIYGSMTARAMENLRGLLLAPEAAKEEVKVRKEVKEALFEEAKVIIEEEITPTEEEEKGGEDLSEQVREPEAGEVRPEAPPQEPEVEGSEGD